MPNKRCSLPICVRSLGFYSQHILALHSPPQCQLWYVVYSTIRCMVYSVSEYSVVYSTSHCLHSDLVCIVCTWPQSAVYISPSTFPHPPPLSCHRYDIFSGAVHVKLHYDALNIFHTGGSVVGVGVDMLVLNIISSRCTR